MKSLYAAVCSFQICYDDQDLQVSFEAFMYFV